MVKTSVVLAAIFATSAAVAQQANIEATWERWVNDAIAAKWEASRNCYPNEKGMMPYCSISLLSPVQDGKRLRLMAFVDQKTS